MIRPPLHNYLESVHAAGGSDLHLSPGVSPRVRVDGVLRALEVEPLSGEQIEKLLQPLLDAATRERFERCRSVDVSYEAGPLGRFRANVFSQRQGTAAVLRRIPASIPSLAELRLPIAVSELGRCPNGLVLVTGTAGSGKSTTLAALVAQIARDRAVHIVTIEDPVEFVYADGASIVTQREVGVHVHTFAGALHAALREDPDVIVVGELRDAETMQLAITAAETGHLVLGTLHTVSAVRAVERIVDAFDTQRQAQVRTQLADVLRGVVSQRLVRLAAGEGRVVACELLLNTAAVAQNIRGRKNAMIESLMGDAASGMQTLETALALLVTQGLVSRASAESVAGDGEKLEAALAVLR